MAQFPPGYANLRGHVGKSEWPRIPSPWASGLAATLYQIDQSQWWSPEIMGELQLSQAKILLAHACAHSAFYRELFQSHEITPSTVTTWEDWRRLPVVTRAQLQRADSAWHCDVIPSEHGALMQHFSSGSTGAPLASFGTSLSFLIKLALVVRNHQWAGRDMSDKAAFILDQGENYSRNGTLTNYWQKSLSESVITGAGLAISVKLPISAQCELLQDFNPAYIFAYPSVVSALANHCLKHKITFASLRQIGTLGEVLSPACRDIASLAFGISIVDGYSAREVGPIALQCPNHDHYHVQSDAVLVEVIDESGNACEPGQTGRVVLTSLHNFASPMIRYEIGDYAELGRACDCGRSLPVLARILGRRRNLLVYPDGERRWPSLSDIGFARLKADGLPEIRQFQIIQHSLTRLEVRLVTARRLDDDQEARARDYLRHELGMNWQIDFTYHSKIERGGRGKFEDFVSHCDGAPR